MDNIKFKETFTYVILAATVLWAVFTVVITLLALANLSQANVLETAGASVLLGSLITWTGLVVQYWFRKKPNEDKTETK